MASAFPHRYPSAMIVLHWVIALAIVSMVTLGWTMGETGDKALDFKLYQLHKSIGLTILVLVSLRLLLRVSLRRPELPKSIPLLERRLAHAGHWTLYILMFALPLTGWLTVSASVYGLPTMFFGLFVWPHIPGVAANQAISEAAGDVHGALVWGMILVLAGHVAAVAKHYWVDGENLLPRMWWRKR